MIAAGGRSTGRCPFTGIINVPEPWDDFAELRAAGVTWDEPAAGWVVPDYVGVKQVFADEARFTKPVRFREIWGRSHLSSLDGEEHKRVRRWWQRIFTPKQAEAWRTALVRPVVAGTLDRFVDRGAADLVEDYARQVPIRVIAAIVGLPWRDDEWLEEYRHHNDMIQNYMFANPFAADGEELARALRSRARMNEMLSPYVEARRDAPTDDIISRLWIDGPELLPGWSEDDVFDTVRNIFFGGTDTTKHALCNALVLLLRNPDLEARLRQDGKEVLDRFVEESLRLNGLVQFRARIAAEETVIGDRAVGKGDTVYAVLASGNRDPAHYERPDEVDLERRSPRDHVAFGFGPTTCLGAPLARVELQEMLVQLLDRATDIKLVDGAEPQFQPGHLRSYAPLPVTFTPTSAPAGTSGF